MLFNEIMNQTDCNKLLLSENMTVVILISSDRTFVAQEIIKTLRYHLQKTETLFLKSRLNKDQFNTLVKKSNVPLIIQPLPKTDVFEIYEFNVLLQMANRKKFLLLTCSKEEFGAVAQKYKIDILTKIVTFNFMDIIQKENTILLETISAFSLNPLYFTYLFTKLEALRRYNIYESLEKDELKEMLKILKEKRFKKAA